MAGDVYQSFRSASSFQELSDSFVAASKGQLKKMKESLDDVMDYLVNNTPLNWLVGPFIHNCLAFSMLKAKVKGRTVPVRKTNSLNTLLNKLHSMHVLC